MRRLRVLGGLVAALAFGACQENLSAPGECPALCPGEQIIVRDTTILPILGGDSTFFGYLARSSRTVLLVSNGLPAGEYRSFVVFPAQRTDSVAVDGVSQAYTVDTVSISFNLQARDTTAKGLTVYLHRIPITTDTTITYPVLAALLDTAEVLDSIQVADTVKSGRIEALFVGDELTKFAGPAADSGKFAVGLTVRADKPTGVRLSVDAAGSTLAPLFENRGRAPAVTDTAKRRQVVQVRPTDVAKYGYVGNRDLSQTANPDLLYLGGPGAARALLRFALPTDLKDSAQILRATLELTPAISLDGLPSSPSGDSVAVRGVVVDLGAKSPPLLTGGLQSWGLLKQGTTDLVTIDLLLLATQWQIKDGPPATVFLALTDEVIGGGFMQPVFYSTRSATGQPRLRVTYGLPTRPGRP